MANNAEQKERLWQLQHTLNNTYPITKAIIHDGGIEVIRKAKKPLQGKLESQPGYITHLSKKSLSRLAFLVSTSTVKFLSILTLTYQETYPTNGRLVKRNLNSFLVKLRRHFSPISYLWFLEFQKRGAPHFHVLTTVKLDSVSRETMAVQWADIVATSGREYVKVKAVHNHAKQLANIRKPDGAKRYALKYALKPHQKTVPDDYKDVGRFWGCSRDVRPRDGIEIDITEDELRQWLEIYEPDINQRMPILLPRYLFRNS